MGNPDVVKSDDGKWLLLGDLGDDLDIRREDGLLLNGLTYFLVGRGMGVREELLGRKDVVELPSIFDETHGFGEVELTPEHSHDIL